MCCSWPFLPSHQRTSHNLQTLPRFCTSCSPHITTDSPMTHACRCNPAQAGCWGARGSVLSGRTPTCQVGWARDLSSQTIVRSLYKEEWSTIPDNGRSTSTPHTQMTPSSWPTCHLCSCNLYSWCH